MMKIIESRYHGPVWETDYGHVHYIVWGPVPTARPRAPRAGWLANLLSWDGHQSNHASGAGLDEVLGIFPRHVAAAFTTTIENEGTEARDGSRPSAAPAASP